MSDKEAEVMLLGCAEALIEKVQTTKDGGFRITIDVPDSEVKLVQALIQKKATGRPMVLMTLADKLE